MSQEPAVERFTGAQPSALDQGGHDLDRHADRHDDLTARLALTPALLTT